MKRNTILIKIICLLFIGFFGVNSTVQADPEKKVILQGFWWDYWHSDYPNSFANYLTELAPRLNDVGINAVWVPPFVKNTGTNSGGYSPFDHYDLGDKFQKGAVTTRFGTKDEVLRMIAVLHSNGIEVLEDIVLNHTIGAGSEDNGNGGEDPDAWNDRWKNFRYVSYATPIGDGSASDYTSRSGRWSKNWENFHPNEGHNEDSGDWCSDWWGPDMCYYEGAYGISSNAEYNPSQSANYNRDNARDWMMWFKKQTAVDGYRWDAVKHFPVWLQQDVLWNVKYALPDWCAGGNTMLSFGEYVGGASEMDNYCYEFANYGDELMMGSFDFSLRSALKSMADGGGYYDMSNIPGTQQSFRYVDYDGGRTHRVVSFVNGHDTFRPELDADGNYIGWDSGQELGGHLDPFSSRLGAAYATMLAMDGNPCVYMEDLFNLSNGKRYTHDPTDPDELPMRSAIKNIIWCHQNLGFKYGSYKVRWQDGDLLVIERSGKAIIAATDNGSSSREEWIDTDFRNVSLKDYSGGSSSTRYIGDDGRFNVKVTQAGDGLGYAIWAPEQTTDYEPYRSHTTTQEWEMADDLGDSHCNSLGQGGALPANSTTQRLVGKIYVASGSDVTYYMHPAEEGNDITVALYDLDGNLLDKSNGTEDVEGSWTALSSAWVAIKIWNNSSSNIGQKAWVRIAYQAPTSIDDTMGDNATTRASIWTGNAGNSSWTDCQNWEQGKVPGTSSKVVIPNNGMIQPEVDANVSIKSLLIEKGEGTTIVPDISVSGQLRVSETSSVLDGTGFICGEGSVDLGTQSGTFDLCSTSPIEEFSDGNIIFSLYPSPVHSTLVVDHGLLRSDNEIVIQDMSNREIIRSIVSDEQTVINVSGLTPGIYLLRLGDKVERFVKE